jgi:hypothetical protein
MSNTILRTIEANRNSERFFWKSAVRTKDALWRASTAASGFARYAVLMAEIHGIPFYRQEKYKKVSFCITCMGRAKHIRQTLEKNILANKRYPNVEFVLLDYNSNDGLKDWVFSNLKKYIDSGTLVYYRTERPTHFHVSRAKNMSHRLASGDILCNLDADNFTGQNFAFYLNKIFSKRSSIFVASTGVVSGTFGRIAFLRDDFFRIGGYDETYDGWGFEDNDILARGEWAGLEAKLLPAPFLKAIAHGDEYREKKTAWPMKKSANRNYRFYAAKIASARLDPAGRARLLRVENPPIAHDEAIRLQ